MITRIKRKTEQEKAILKLEKGVQAYLKEVEKVMAQLQQLEEKVTK